MEIRYKHIHFTLNPGVCIHVVGPNGIGKTTMANQLVQNGFFLPKEWQISYLFQMPLSSLGDRRPVDLVQAIYGVTKNNTIHPVLEDFISKDLGVTPIKHLSGGENQWLKIGIMLSMNADLYIWDEPTTYLDQNKKIQLKTILKELMEKKRFIIIEHDSDFVHSCSHNIKEIVLE